jgi:phosphoserine phosphatase RsbU/P
MTKPLRVLLVEDSERDAALLLLYLRQGGYEPTIRRVQTAFTMKAQLDTAEWDVIISDVNLPGFDAYAALKVLQESGLKLPFIVVSAEISKAIMEGLAKVGAAEYLSKFEMRKIVPIIERAVQGRNE